MVVVALFSRCIYTLNSSLVIPVQAPEVIITICRYIAENLHVGDIKGFP